MLQRILILLAGYILCCAGVFAQTGEPSLWHYRHPQNLIKRGYISLYAKNDSEYIYLGRCKNFSLTIPRTTKPLYQIASPQKEAPFVTVHGNVQYDFLYRSFIDTPFYQNDLRQHTVQTNLKIQFKDRYPVNLRLTNRISNSPYFRNYLDGGLQLDKYTFQNKLKEEILQRLMQQLPQWPDLAAVNEAIKEKTERYGALKQWLNEPDVIQKLIEERERQYFDSIRQLAKAPQPEIVTALPDGLKDSVQTKLKKRPDPNTLKDTLQAAAYEKFEEYTNDKKKELGLLEKEIAGLQHSRDSLKRAIQLQTATFRQKIAQAANYRDLKKIAIENGIQEAGKKRLQDVLAGFDKLAIGRSVLDYSELTAWNVSVTGINLEYNPASVYTAFAMGKIDYGFRDFLGKSLRNSKQNIAIGRIGWGNKNKRAVILSLFEGKKYAYANALVDSVKNYTKVVGYSVETIIKKDNNTSLSFEIAKSTKPVAGSLHQTERLNGILNFSDNSNMALNVKGEYYFPLTETRLSGYYRKAGEAFQSFNLFSYNTDQTAWALKGEQPFFKKRADLALMLRRNDFNNPYTDKTYKTNTVFKSAQVRIHIPRWPVLSAGYYPGSQIYLVNKEKLRENVYYILNANVVHNYNIKGVRAVSSLMYNQYFNQSTDSGFIAYKGVTYAVMHTFFSRKLQLLFNYTYTDQEQLKYYTLESGLDYAATANIKMGGAVKYNKLTTGEVCWGGRLQAQLTLKSLGALQLQYEKSFLPTVYNKLFPVEMGRLTWFKYF